MESSGLFGNFVSFPPFHLPEVMEVAMVQVLQCGQAGVELMHHCC